MLAEVGGTVAAGNGEGMNIEVLDPNPKDGGNVDAECDDKLELSLGRGNDELIALLLLLLSAIPRLSRLVYDKFDSMTSFFVVVENILVSVGFMTFFPSLEVVRETSGK